MKVKWLSTKVILGMEREKEEARLFGRTVHASKENGRTMRDAMGA